MMVTDFRSVSDVYRFLRATVEETEAGIEDGSLTVSSGDEECSVDLEYVAATVTSMSHRLILSYRFLSQGDMFNAFAANISKEYPHLLMTHLVIGGKQGEVRLRQIRGGHVSYDRTMPAVVGSAVLEELESEPQHEETLTLHLDDLIDLTESEFIDHLGRLKTPVFSDDE